MAVRKPHWPEVGDLVIATIETVTDYGAYAKLDEFEKQGLLHVSEISSSWIRNIRDFVKEGQKVVLKVIRVDLEKGHIDLSLRRVTKSERIEKVLSCNKDRKTEALLRGVAEKVGLISDEIYAKVGTRAEEKFGLCESFNTVKVKGILKVRCNKPNGIKVIKEAFQTVKAQKLKDAELRFAVIAAPKYRFEVLAENYKRAEDIFQKSIQNLLTNIAKAGGQGSFRREK